MLLVKYHFSGICSSEKKKCTEGKVHFALEKMTKENIGVKV